MANSVECVRNINIPIRCDWSLKLEPVTVEMAFWACPRTQRTYMLCDAMATANAILLNSTVLVWNMWAHASYPPQTLMMVFFVFSAVLQLTFLLSSPAQYLRHRLHINIMNRSVRAVMTGVAAAVLTPTVAAVWGSALNSKLDAQMATKRPWVRLLRPLLIPSISTMSHANFVVPFRYVFIFQLVTCVCALYALYTAMACWYVTAPGMQQTMINCCLAVKQLIHTYSVELFGGLQGSLPEAGPCSEGISAVLVMLGFEMFTIIMLVPCLALYLLEWSLKDHFVRTQQQQMTVRWPGHMLACAALLLCTGLVAAWSVCEAAVSTLPQLLGYQPACDAGGWLAWHKTALE